MVTVLERIENTERTITLEEVEKEFSFVAALDGFYLQAIAIRTGSCIIAKYSKEDAESAPIVKEHIYRYSSTMGYRSNDFIDCLKKPMRFKKKRGRKAAEQ